MAINLTDNIRVGQQKPLDDKYFNGLSPYTSLLEATNSILTSVRHIGLTVNIAGIEYWFKDGITNGDLVIKTTPFITNTSELANDGADGVHPFITQENIPDILHEGLEKTTLVDADNLTGLDSENSYSLIKLTLLNLYNYLKGKFDSIYTTTSAVSTQISTALSAYATTSYVDTSISSAAVGILNDRGNYDASTNLFPSSGGSGSAGVIKKGNLWTINVGGTLGTSVVTVGDVVRALTDTPGQTSTNWAIGENNFGYVAENLDNKTSTIAGNETSTTKYSSIKGVIDYFTTSKIKSLLGQASASVDGWLSSTDWNAFNNKLPTEVGVTTGVALTFTTDRVYGLVTPETGNITFSTTGALVGVTNIIIHNNTTTAPTFATNMKKLSGSSSYVVNVINYIYVTYISSTEVIYSINQRT